jgi:uncharacterized membrane-anchored protein YitT (DUF2179 family)
MEKSKSPAGKKTKKKKFDHRELEKNVFLRTLIKILFLTLGAALASVGLEIFLIPNNIIDGGVVGISIMASYLSGLPIGVFLIVINIPFLILGYRHIGKTFAFSTLYAVLCLSVGVSVLHPIPGLTHDYILAALFGGVILGAGVGLIIRTGGSLDGTEVIAIILDRKSSFSVGEIIMFFNLFILSAAGFVFGWDNAMYSLLTYFVAYRAIDVAIDGINETKGVFVISDRHEDISDAINDRLGREFTVFESLYNGSAKKNYIIFVVVTRLEIAKLKSIVNGFDENALTTIVDMEVEGKRFRKRAIH